MSKLELFYFPLPFCGYWKLGHLVTKLTQGLDAKNCLDATFEIHYKLAAYDQ